MYYNILQRITTYYKALQSISLNFFCIYQKYFASLQHQISKRAYLIIKRSGEIRLYEAPTTAKLLAMCQNLPFMGVIIK
jgi:hypothetical protein